jgi:hypothetical protein
MKPPLSFFPSKIELANLLEVLLQKGEFLTLQKKEGLELSFSLSF